MGDYTPDEKAKKIIERRTASMDYWRPIEDEIVEVRQALKCKVDPIFKKDKNGKDTNQEDTSRTNVCMPGLSIMARKNVARLTANAPEIEYISVSSPQIGEKLSAWGRMQYDLTGEAEVIRKHVMQAEAFGFSAVKLYQNDVVIRRPVRVRTINAKREDVLRARGMADTQIQSEVETNGPELGDDEKLAALAEFGAQFTYQLVKTKYSGPCTKFIFFGDIHLPPQCASLDTADWIIEDFEETPQWFEYWAGRTFADPETGEEKPILDEKVVDDLLKEEEGFTKGDRETLRERFRGISKLDSDASGVSYKKLSCRKKFQFNECHEVREDGTKWISWVVKGKYVGEMPYPIDLNGEYQYTDLVFFPDLTDAIGDSTPRLARYLHRLHNQNVGARTDLINANLRPFVKTRAGADIPDEAIERTAYREIQLQNPEKDMQIEQRPQLPAEAWEQENSILRQMAMLEPSLASADLAGTNQNPQSGKTATVGVLAQRERDALLQFKIDGLNIFWKKHQQKKLWMLQQTLQDEVTIAQQYLPANQPQPNMDGGAATAITMMGGQAKVMKLGWEEIQDDIDVQPRAGSTLSKEDEFHAMRAQQFFANAAANPDVFNKFYAAEVYAATIKDVDMQKAVRPEPPPSPQVPKTQVNINIPLDKMPELVNPILAEIGLQPVPGMEHTALLKGIKDVGEAADAAGKLAEPVDDGSQDGLRKTGADRVDGAGGRSKPSGAQGGSGGAQ